MASQANAYIVGAYEHPTRKADDKSLAQLHADVAKGALEEAGRPTCCTWRMPRKRLRRASAAWR
jgi:hypothetical protein